MNPLMKKLLSVLLLLLLATACASTVVPPPKTAEHYLQEGEANFEKGRYEDAIANWEKVRDSYFSPELNILSELKIAEAYFLSERYVEAATAYEDFLKQHPDHPRTADVLFQLGLSYFHQMLAPDRDQTATRNALSTFTDLQKRFPDFSRAEELTTKIAQCSRRRAIASARSWPKIRTTRKKTRPISCSGMPISCSNSGNGRRMPSTPCFAITPPAPMYCKRKNWWKKTTDSTLHHPPSRPLTPAP